MAKLKVHLLLVGEDDRCIVRLRLPRWAVGVVLGGAAVLAVLTASSLYLSYGSYRALASQRASAAAWTSRVAEQQALLDRHSAQVRALRAEIDGWHAIHARIFAPFGPDAGPAAPSAGIGGGTARSSPAAQPADAEEEMTRLASLVRQEGDALRALEAFLSRASAVIAALPSRWPIRGPVNSEFGLRLSPWTPVEEYHGGIDIGAPVGMPVKAPAPGVVVFAGRQPDFGITVIIDHGHDTRSLYGHLSKLIVRADRPVQRGDVIALSGNTGRSSGPHLHYEIQVNGEPVNPNTYLWD
jgi:murein DD-endopeptidase MepM/ murein hydrolase activator NlpD